MNIIHYFSQKEHGLKLRMRGSALCLNLRPVLSTFSSQLWSFSFKLTLALVFSLLAFSFSSKAQNINIESLKGIGKAKPIRVSGGINANSVMFAGNGATMRSPFTYFLQGSVNANLFGQINLPFSFNLTNSGHGFSYPTLPNRLSLNPTYKWISGHIGDVSMTFSPYTLNGHQFRGLGFDLTPDGPWKVSAMYGRLNKAVEYDPMVNNAQPGYKRMGYGAKVGFEKTKYMVGLTVFRAKDEISSLVNRPDSLLIFPQSNLVMSWEARVKPMKGLELSTEFATSGLTRDLRDTSEKAGRRNYLNLLSKGNASTAYYNAFKSQLNYSYKKSTLGVGYERVAPGYQTLGAYYFNSDLENITVNMSQVFLKDKANIAVNVGFQRDDLDHNKASGTRRFVGSANLGYNPSEKVQTTVSYSNFQTYMNMRPQFDYINQASQFQNIDTLNYIQISQNANANVNWMTRKNEKQTQALNLNLSFQDATDQQGGIVANGNASQFYNLAAAYNVVLIKQGMGFTLAYNTSYNTIGKNDFLTMGPTLSVNAKFLKKTLVTGFSTSYNLSNSLGVRQSSVLNIRANASYVVLKKHNLNFSLMNQNRNLVSKGKTNDMTATLGYGYSFK
ncbi:TonB-dependent receptor [Pedobacter endophyticus]|uniref:TonB-dependent receptor n=1 Tax=Pedobacter endophyticus TaxID=2789740 RepID=A0A7S9KYZ3_9SPHI|nr:TonB-dependent receptor [Pedobacter endophyticus]QPH39452.1 TonB-dependent receptor [Pedobacter endophyticus]